MIDMKIIIFSIPLFFAIFGFKMLDGWYDVPSDRKRNKTTFPAFLSRYIDLEYGRDIAFGFMYACFLMVAFIAPQMIFGVIFALLIIAVSHLALRRKDMEVRLGIAFASTGILAFIIHATSLFVALH
jgi:1,4-dihydroxy-2-naphthoate octaprenyltransferase